MKEAWFRRLCATIIGIIFYVSGVSKIIDPVGTALIAEEYFKLFHLNFLSFAAPTAGFFIGLLEMTIAAAMLCKVYRLFFAFVTCALILVFTIVTTVLVIVQPDMNCGCFGEMLKIDHETSFYKNIFLLLLAAGAFIRVFIDYYKEGVEKAAADALEDENDEDDDADVDAQNGADADVAADNDLKKNRIFKYRNRKYRLVLFYATIIASLGFQIYNKVHLPLLDFTEMAPGAELSGSEKVDIPKIAYIYEKDGWQLSFDLDA
ncbi:MAG: hypothetical protein HUJ95_03885, partial [Bacteroidales bacterium]|nr:hypothetical protein [Bacteroidales bacterium]